MMMMMMMISQGPWFPTGREDLEAGTTSQNLHCGLQPNRSDSGMATIIDSLYIIGPRQRAFQRTGNVLAAILRLTPNCFALVSVSIPCRADCLETGISSGP